MPRASSQTLRVGLLCATAVIIYCYFPYTYSPYGMYPEEIITLRRLVENPGIQINNLTFMPNVITTYVFVPFYLLMAMVSVFIGQDVVVGIWVMWAFTSLVSILCLIQLSFFITESRWPALIIIVMSTIHAIFYQHWRSDMIVSFMPTADRYAYASMCLVPLALVHFMVHMRDEKTNVGMFVALIYLIIEIAFVHAKECLIALGMICVFILLAICFRNEFFKQIKRCLTLVVICAGALILYKYTNLFFNPELKAFTYDMQWTAWETLKAYISQHGIAKTIYPGPDMGDSYASTKNMWSIYYSPGLFFFYSAVFLMPVYILRSRSIYQLFLPLVLCLCALLTISGGSRAFVMMIVSSRYLFSLNFIFILCGLMIFSDAVYQAARPLKSPSTMLRNDYYIIYFLLLSLLLQPVLRLTGLVTENVTIFGSVTFDAIFYLMCGAGSFLKALSLAKSQKEISRPFIWTWEPESIGKKAALFIITVSMLGACVITNDKPPLGRNETAPLPNLRSTQDFIKFEYSPSTFTGHTVTDLNRLAVAGYLNTSNNGVKGENPLEVDPSTFEWIRTNAPTGSVWVASSTSKLLVYSNVYSPVYTYNGEFLGSYSMNTNFLNRFKSKLKNGFWIETILSNSDMLESLIQDYGVEYLLVEPREYDEVKQFLHQVFVEQHTVHLEVIYDERRHIVIRCTKQLNAAYQ